MIIVRLLGGLGNQMFQYAFGRRLALLNGVPLRLDMRFLEPQRTPAGDTMRYYQLDGWRIQATIAGDSECDQLTWENRPRRVHRAYRLFQQVLPYSLRRLGLERSRRYEPSWMKCKASIYLNGYWQCWQYYGVIRTQLLEEFQPLLPLDERNQRMADQILAVQAVAVHIRRGDYLSNPNAARYHGVCSIGYYRRCMENMIREFPPANFFVFSDDLEWSRRNLPTQFPMTFVDVNKSRADHLDLHLMSLCHSFIIANSSFSWWAAWMGNRPGKVVYAPVPWINDPAVDMRDLYPPDWQKTERD